jgi:hypothetical protein
MAGCGPEGRVGGSAALMISIKACRHAGWELGNERTDLFDSGSALLYNNYFYIHLTKLPPVPHLPVVTLIIQAEVKCTGCS